MDSAYNQNSIRLVHEFLDQAAARLPQKTAVVTDERSATYEELATASRRLAAWFHQAGIRRGDRMAILLPNSIPLITTFMAASRIGAIFFVVNPAVKPYHLHHIMEDAQPGLIVTTRQRHLEGRLDQYAKILTLEDDWEHALSCPSSPPSFPGISYDPACLIYTSGSTGKPKAVISSHSNIVFATQAIQQCLGYQEQDVIGNFLPLSFDVGLYQIFLSFQVGATLALGQGIHAGPGLLNKLCQWQVTGLPAVPSLIAMLVRLSKRNPQHLPNLRFITNTGAHLAPTSISEVQRLFPSCSVFVMFGLTECKRVSILPPNEYERKSTSVGKPLPDTECFIIDPDGRVLPPGEVGELVVRGPHVMLGYWYAPEMTAKRFRIWGPGQERVLFTGDACRMDEEGYLYFEGRADDIYKQGGYRVSAVEIEEAACTVYGVHQAALIPPDRETDAILFVTGNVSREMVFDELRSKIEDYKLPPHIAVLEEFPLTPNGKTDKQQLKALYCGEAYT